MEIRETRIRINSKSTKGEYMGTHGKSEQFETVSLLSENRSGFGRRNFYLFRKRSEHNETRSLDGYSKFSTPLAVCVYLTAIVAANLSVLFFGKWITPLNAFLFIGLDLTLRDTLHESWTEGRLILKMGVLILAGSILSFIINHEAGRIAIASCVAFGGAALIDAIVFHSFRHKKFFEKSNYSNLAGASVDSILFPSIAFGMFLPWIILVQFVAKSFGGLVWIIILRRMEC